MPRASREGPPASSPFSAFRREARAGAGDPIPDRFDGFFDGTPWREPARDALLDHPPARAWLRLIDETCHRDRYTFQAPLGGRAGPRVTIDGTEMLLMSSYDYLGLLGDRRIESAAVEAVERHGTGSGGVRLLSGTVALHRELERALARFKGTEAAIAFSSGYVANLGAIGALFGPRDRVVVDERIHRSVIDACRMAHVPMQRFAHNDPDALDAALAREGRHRRTLVVVEGIYSMDGDVCVLPEIVEVKNRHGAYLMVDEAHSIGTLGPTGRGVHEHFGVPAGEVDIWMGSLSKAIPSVGGYLAGSRELMIYLQHGAASFMFSAALCPASAGAARAAIEILEEEPGRLERLRRNGHLLRSGLQALGYDTGDSATAIVPVHCGSRDAAFRLARALYGDGVVAVAVIPPAVPEHASRLRLCATAAHREDDLGEALEAFAERRRPVRRNGVAP